MLVTFKMSYSWKYVVLDGGEESGAKSVLAFLPAVIDTQGKKPQLFENIAFTLVPL